MAVQDQKIIAPDQCLNMVELRAEIDRLDRRLVQLLSERQRYIERAAQIKGCADKIRDEDRIADVLAKVSLAALATGLDVSIAQGVWRELMDRSIALEMERFRALQRFK